MDVTLAFWCLRLLDPSFTLMKRSDLTKLHLLGLKGIDYSLTGRKAPDQRGRCKRVRDFQRILCVCIWLFADMMGQTFSGRSQTFNGKPEVDLSLKVPEVCECF
jgi:hypothetical protein